ncbi:MAG: DUF2892 domain-containing protein [Limnochordaceae bacterium]|nr:DUF2892 domain-containing protein [Limnochordaceae bacterium]
MQSNVGRVDRWIRLALGAALLLVALLVAEPIRWVALVLAIVLVATGGAGYCPLYGACGISTSGARSSDSARKA